jgi:hypothetical protein
MTSSRRLRLVILGMMGRSPYGGQSWLYLNWLSGFNSLGHDVWYVEDDTVWPYDPLQNIVTDDCSYAVSHISRCMEEIGLPNKWAFRLADRKGACWGLSEPELKEVYRSCDALLNIVGATDLREEHLSSRLRVYVQSDPVISELRLARGDLHTKDAFDNHDIIFTYGENYGSADCGVPVNGIEYKKTRQPIDLTKWQMTYNPNASYFTTIGNYRQIGEDIDYNGRTYGWSKHHEWEKFIELPKRTSQKFEVALKITDPIDHEMLEANGWKVISPFEMSLDIFGRYMNFIRRSRAEWTVAKDQNVSLRSGWFSERDACYLASGKPVVAQDTGFSKFIPTGKGLFAFNTMEESIDAIEKINCDYAMHCKAAREIAEEYFESKKVASHLLEDLGLK